MPETQFKLIQLDDIFSASPLDKNLLFNIPEADENSSSFFFPYYQKYISPMGRFPNKPVDDESELPAPFRTYESPIWTNWTEVWSKMPIELNVNVTSTPELEFLFQSTLFRLSLEPAYLSASQEAQFIYQGTTFTFPDSHQEDIRFVVEWLQFIHNHAAYLKIVAMSSNGERAPYSDPDYPSFILIAPLCLVYVPTPPPGLELYYAYPLDIEENEIMEEDGEVCWACGNKF